MVPIDMARLHQGIRRGSPTRDRRGAKEGSRRQAHPILHLALLLALLTVPPPARAGMPVSSKSSYGSVPRSVDASEAQEQRRKRQLETQMQRLRDRNAKLKESFGPGVPAPGDWKELPEGLESKLLMQQMQPFEAKPATLFPPASGLSVQQRPIAPGEGPANRRFLAPPPPPAPAGFLRIFMPYDDPRVENRTDLVLVEESSLNPFEERHKATAGIRAPEPLPVPIATGVVRARVVGSRVRVEARYEVRAEGDSYHVLPLGLGRAVVDRARLGEEPLLISGSGEALIPAPVTGSLLLEYELEATRTEEHGRFELPVLACPMLRIECALPGTGLVVEMVGACGLETRETDGGTVATAQAAGGTLRVDYAPRPREAPALATTAGGTDGPTGARTSEEKARVEAEAHVSYVLRDTVLEATIHAVYRATRPGIASCSVLVPDSMELIRIWEMDEGRARPIDTHSLDPGDGAGSARLTVYLPARRTRPVDLRVQMKAVIPADLKLPVELPPFALIDVTKASGTASFTATDPLSTCELEDRALTRFLEPLDNAGIPAAFQDDSTRSALRCFRIRRPDGRDWGPIPVTRTRLRKAGGGHDLEILRADLDTVISPVEAGTAGERLCLTRSRYQVKDPREQFLEIELPAGARILSAWVRNRAVKPGVKDDRTVMIPLVPTMNAPPYMVEIVHASPVPPFGWLGRLDLTLPRPVVSILELTWSVHVPDRWFVRAGDLSPGLEPQEGDDRTRRMDEDSVAGGVAARAGGKRRMPNSILERAPRVPSTGEPREGSTAGLLPVRIPFPRSGRELTFRKALVSPDVGAVAGSFRYFSRSGAESLMTLLMALSFMCMAGVFHAWARGAPWVGPASGVALSLVALTAIRSFFSLQTSYLGGVILALILAGAQLLATPIRRWMLLIVLLALPGGALRADPPDGSPRALVPTTREKLVEEARTRGPVGLLPTSVLERLARHREKVRAAAEPETAKVPPVPFAILAGTIDGALEGGVARLEIEYDVRVLAAGWQRIPLIEGDLTVSEITVDGAPGQVVVDQTEALMGQELAQNSLILDYLTANKSSVDNLARSISFRALIREPGTHRIRLKCEASVQTLSEGQYRLILKPPPFPTGTLTLRFGTSGFRVQLNGLTVQEATSRWPDSRLSDAGSPPRATDGGRDEDRTAGVPRGSETGAPEAHLFRIPIPVVRPLTIDWSEKAVRAGGADPRPGTEPAPSPPESGDTDRTGDAARPARPDTPDTAAGASRPDPLVVADCVTRITVDEAALSGSTLYRFQVHRRGVEALAFDVPRDLVIHDVKEAQAPGADRVWKFQTRPEGDGTRLTVQLKGRVSGSMSLALTYNLPFPEIAAGSTRITVPVPRLMSTDARFESGLVVVGHAEGVRVSEESASGVEHLEPERLDPRTRVMLQGIGTLLYRYPSHPWSLSLVVQKQESQGLPSAVITRLHAITNLQEQNQVTQVTMSILNNGNPHLRLVVPEGLKLTRTRVDGQPLDPNLDEQNRYLIGLPTGNGETGVTVTYDLKGGVSNPVRLALPRANLAIVGEGLNWTIQAPPGQVLRSLPGAMTVEAPPSWKGPLVWGPGLHRQEATLWVPMIPWEQDITLTVGFGSSTGPVLLGLLSALLGLFGALFLVSGAAWIHRPAKGSLRIAGSFLAGIAALVLERTVPGTISFASRGCLVGLGLAVLVPILRTAWGSRLGTGTAAVIALLLVARPVPAQPVAAPPAPPASPATPSTGTPAESPSLAVRGWVEIGREILVPSKDLPDMISGGGRWTLTARPLIESIFRELATPIVRPSRPDEPPPVRWLILKGRLTGRARGDAIDLTGTYTCQVHRAGTLDLGFDPGEVSVRSIRIDGVEVPAMAPAGDAMSERLTVNVGGPGLKVVTIELTARIVMDSGHQRLQLQIPSCPDTELELALSGQRPSATVVPSTHIEMDGSRLRTRLKYSQTLFVDWSDAAAKSREPLEPPVETTPAVEEPPAFEAQVDEELAAEPGRVETLAVITFQMLRGSLSSFVLEHPVDFHLTEVQGPEVAGFETAPGSSRSTVQFRTKRHRTFQVTVRGLSPLPPATTDDRGTRFTRLAAPRLVAAGASAQRGFLRLHLPPGEDVREVGLAGLARRDPSELPSPPRGARGLGDRLYRYFEPGWELVLDLLRHPMVRVPSTRVLRGFVHLSVPRQGYWFGIARFDVTNNTRQFLEVRLPASTGLLSCFVDGRPRHPGRGADGSLLVPLVQADSADESLRTFPLELAYMYAPPGRTPLGLTGRILLPVPALELPVDHLEVSVATPTGTFLFAEHEGLRPRQNALMDVISGTLSLPDVPSPLAVVASFFTSGTRQFRASMSEFDGKENAVDASELTAAAPGGFQRGQIVGQARRNELESVRSERKSGAGPPTAAPGRRARRMGGKDAFLALKTEAKKAGVYRDKSDLLMDEDAAASSGELDDLGGFPAEESPLMEPFDSRAPAPAAPPPSSSAGEGGGGGGGEAGASQEALFQTLLRMGEGRRGALPVRVRFQPRSDRLQTSEFDAVLPAGTDDAGRFTLRYVDMTWPAPVLAWLFFLIPIVVLGTVFAPLGTRSRRPLAFTVFCVGGLLAYGFQLWGLTTLSCFLLGIPAGLLGLPIFGLIRRAADL